MAPTAASEDLPVEAKIIFQQSELSSTQESVESESSSDLSMPNDFATERLSINSQSDQSQTPHDNEHFPPPFRFKGGRHATPNHASKRTVNDACTGNFAEIKPPRKSQNKKQRTTAAREDPCCPCSTSACCSERNCPCAKARRPCRDCDPGHKRCNNSTASHNHRIKAANRLADNASAGVLRGYFGLEKRKKLPYIQTTATPAEKTDESDPYDLANKTAKVLFPVTGREAIASKQPTTGSDGENAKQSEEEDPTHEGEEADVHTTAANEQNEVDGTRPDGGETTNDGANPPNVRRPPSVPNPYTQNRDSTRRAARTQAATMQGGASAAGQAATMQGGTIGNGNGGRRNPPRPPDNVLHQLLVGNGHAPPPEQEDDEPIMPPALHRVFTEAELRALDPLLQQFTEADRKLISVYGDTVHANDGSHLHGEVDPAEDLKMQRLHHRVASCKLSLYSLPSGRWANRFLDLQTKLFKDAREGRCNSELPLIFAPCILRKRKNAVKFHETKPLIWARMDAWEAGRLVALVKDVEEGAMEDGWGLAHDSEFDLESTGRRYNSMVLGGKMRAAMRMVTDRDPGGLLAPDDICEKEKCPVIEVLRKKRPEARIPGENSFHEHENTDKCLETMPVFCYEDDVAKRSAKLQGGAGPCGVEGTMLRNWLIRHWLRSEKL